MKPILICNWKTYIQSEQAAKELIEAIEPSEKADIVVCPSTVHIAAVEDSAKEKGIYLGAQDISISPEKPQTGRVTGAQLKDLQATHALVGHAETRANGVTNTMVAKKAQHALMANITPIICLSEQEKGKKAGEEVLKQLEEIISELQKEGCKEKIHRSIIAYEPTEYIGADAALSPNAVRDIVKGLRNTLAKKGYEEMRIIYGGAADETTTGTLLREGKVNGFLLGRAGSDAIKISGIIKTI